MDNSRCYYTKLKDKTRLIYSGAEQQVKFLNAKWYLIADNNEQLN